MIEDADAAHVAWAEAAYRSGTMARMHLDQIKSAKLESLSSIAFGGPDLRTIYLGCLLGDQLPRCRAPVAGVPMAHWNW
jgi:sugar lactone lactonase YvrE